MTSGVVTVGWCEPDDSAALRTLLDEDELARYRAYRQPADRARFVTGRALVKAMAAERLQRRPVDISLSLRCPRCGGAHGKPTIEGVEFSVAHAGERVAVAMTTAAPVGIDVEVVGTSDLDELAEQALSADELQRWHALATDEQPAAFFRQWARKEAVLKCTGDGLFEPMKDVSLSPPGDAEFWLSDFDLGDRYAAAIAVRTDTAPTLSVRRVDITDAVAALRASAVVGAKGLEPPTPSL